MGDGRTRQIDSPGSGKQQFDEFMGRFAVRLVALRGAAAGREFALDQPSRVLGRGPQSDLLLRDDTLSEPHAVFEFADGAFRVRDLGSTNGTHVNGSPVDVAPLANGDRIQVGQHLFQVVCEPRERPPAVHVIED